MEKLSDCCQKPLFNDTNYCTHCRQACNPVEFKTFKDLEFKSHHIVASIMGSVFEPVMAEYKDAKQARIIFDNGLKLSVLFGSTFYSNGINTYEAWCSHLDDEPLGYLSEDEVTGYMIKLQKEVL